MASIPNPESKSAVWDLSGEKLCPAGRYYAKCLDVQDRFKVERQKYQSEETELRDEANFLWGFVDATGQKYRVAQWPMRISGNEKATLMKFLKRCLGESPKIGWDYALPVEQGGMKGRVVQLTVVHKSRTAGGVYARIDEDTASPAPADAKVGPVPGAAVPAPVPAAAPSASEEEVPF